MSDILPVQSDDAAIDAKVAVIEMKMREIEAERGSLAGVARPSRERRLLWDNAMDTLWTQRYVLLAPRREREEKERLAVETRKKEEREGKKQEEETRKEQLAKEEEARKEQLAKEKEARQMADAGKPHAEKVAEAKMRAKERREAAIQESIARFMRDFDPSQGRHFTEDRVLKSLKWAESQYPKEYERFETALKEWFELLEAEHGKDDPTKHWLELMAKRASAKAKDATEAEERRELAKKQEDDERDRQL